MIINSNRAIRGPVTAVPMVGQSGVVVEPDTQNNQVVVRADETVLWSGNYTPGDGSGTTNVSITLADGISNYEMIRVETEGKLGGIIFLKGNTTRGYDSYVTAPDSDSNNNIIGLLIKKALNDDTHLTFKCGYGTSYATAYRTNQDWGYYTLRQIVGINRIANN